MQLLVLVSFKDSLFLVMMLLIIPWKTKSKIFKSYLQCFGFQTCLHMSIPAQTVGLVTQDYCLYIPAYDIIKFIYCSLKPQTTSHSSHQESVGRRMKPDVNIH